MLKIELKTYTWKFFFFNSSQDSKFQNKKLISPSVLNLKQYPSNKYLHPFGPQHRYSIQNYVFHKICSRYVAIKIHR